MGSLIVGTLFSIGILVGAFLYSKSNIALFINIEGIMIVLGGTFSIMMMSNRFVELQMLAKNFWRYIFGKNRNLEIKRELIEISKQIEQGKMPTTSSYPFLNKSLTWLSAGLRGETLERLLEDGARMEVERVFNSANILQNVAKYPPALGMIGTVFGIIGIFNGLGNAEAQMALGMNLAFAMTATLYGLVTANFVFSPIAELMHQAAEEEQVLVEMVVDTVKHWSKNESTFYITEHIGLYEEAA